MTCITVWPSSGWRRRPPCWPRPTQRNGTLSRRLPQPPACPHGRLDQLIQHPWGARTHHRVPGHPTCPRGRLRVACPRSLRGRTAFERGKERPMRRGAKPAKAKVEARLSVARKSPKNEASGRRELEKRLTESLEREKATGELLQEKTRALTQAHAHVTEALNQQTATSQILKMISSSPIDIQPVFDAIVRRAKRLLSGFSATVTKLVGDELHLAAFTTTSEAGDEFLKSRYPRPLADNPLSEQAVRDRAPCFASDTETDPRYSAAARERARARGFRSQLSAPMLREDRVIGVISVTRHQTGPFSTEEIALLQTFADQAVIAIENVRLFKELEARNHDLTEALEQQTATSEILRVISQSPTDVQPVFDIIAERAVSLCGAEVSAVSRFDGTLLQLVALHNITQAGVEAVRASFPMRPDAQTTSARAFRDRALVQIQDVLADPTYAAKDTAQAGGWRCGLG